MDSLRVGQARSLVDRIGGRLRASASRRAVSAWGAIAMLCFAGPAGAQVDLGVAARKLVVIDRAALGASSKTVFLASDAALAEGLGADPALVGARLEIRYPDDAAAGSFSVPAGAWDGATGWRAAGGGLRYSNKLAPGGDTQVKSLGVKTQRSIKLAAGGSGDEPLDIVGAGAPAGTVTTILTLTDAGQTLHYCSAFDSCKHKPTGGGLGAKLTCSKGQAVTCPDDVRFTRMTKGRRPSHLFVIALGAMNSAEKVMIASLQGLASRLSDEQIWIDQDAGGYDTWLADLEANYGVTTSTVADPWELVDHFAPLVDRYLLYGAGDSSVNAATSLAGVEEAVVVEASIEGQAIAHGLSLAMDVRGQDEAWVVANHGSRLNPLVAVEQIETFEHQLRDYAVLSRALTFYDGNSAFRDQVVEALDADGVTFGWGDATLGEDVFVGASSDRGVFTLAADHAHNMAPLSGIPAEPLAQNTHGTPVAQAGKHYAAFLLTDGDNIQWTLGTFATEAAWFGSPVRGNFDMGYALPPPLVELTPSVVQWYYDNASTAPGRDFFVVGPSGGGYFYPSRYPSADLAAHVDRLAGWMEDGDLNIVQILDSGAFESNGLWDVYTAKDVVDGLFYLEYADYSGEQGRLRWSNAKPVLAPRAKIWTGLPGSDTASVTGLLNAGVGDATSPLGYSLIMLAAWSNSLADVQTVVDALDPDVEVVTPGDLVQLITDNVPHDLVLRHDYTGSDYETAAMTLVGHALWITDNDALFQPRPQRLRLTSNNGGQNGAAWLAQPIDPSRSWSTVFRFQISYPVGGGADGMAFHIQSDGAAVNPGFLGSFANPHLSVVVDTWDNGEGTSESLRVFLNGSQILFNDLLDFAADPTPGSLPHVFRMELEYAGDAHMLHIRLIDEGGTAALVNSVPADLSGFAPSWPGFSATTGGAAENHDVRTWYLAAALP